MTAGLVSGLSIGCGPCLAMMALSLRWHTKTGQVTVWPYVGQNWAKQILLCGYGFYDLSYSRKLLLAY